MVLISFEAGGLRQFRRFLKLTIFPINSTFAASKVVRHGNRSFNLVESYENISPLLITESIFETDRLDEPKKYRITKNVFRYITRWCFGEWYEFALKLMPIKNHKQEWNIIESRRLVASTLALTHRCESLTLKVCKKWNLFIKKFCCMFETFKKEEIDHVNSQRSFFTARGFWNWSLIDQKTNWSLNFDEHLKWAETSGAALVPATKSMIKVNLIVKWNAKICSRSRPWPTNLQPSDKKERNSL